MASEKELIYKIDEALLEIDKVKIIFINIETSLRKLSARLLKKLENQSTTK